MSHLDEVIVNKKTIVYVGGVDPQVTEQILENLFIAFGDIVSITLPRDPKTNAVRGHAFIEFEAPEDAEAAINNLHNNEFYGRILTCNVANHKSVRDTGVWGKEQQEQSVNIVSEDVLDDTTMKE